MIPEARLADWETLMSWKINGSYSGGADPRRDGTASGREESENGQPSVESASGEPSSDGSVRLAIKGTAMVGLFVGGIISVLTL
jgi:hypothetical protein